MILDMLTIPGWNICLPDLSRCSLLSPPPPSSSINVSHQPERKGLFPPPVSGSACDHVSVPVACFHLSLSCFHCFSKTTILPGSTVRPVSGDGFLLSLCAAPEPAGSVFILLGTGRLETEPLSLFSLASFRRQQRLLQRHRRPGHHHASDHPKRCKLARLPPSSPEPTFTQPARFSRSWPAPSSAKGARGSSRSATSAGRPSRSTSH